MTVWWGQHALGFPDRPCDVPDMLGVVASVFSFSWDKKCTFSKKCSKNPKISFFLPKRLFYDHQDHEIWHE